MSMHNCPAYKVAVAHVAPVFLDTGATVAKACALIAEAARHGARLIAFPETYVPAFPVWAALKAPIHNHALFKRLALGERPYLRSDSRLQPERWRTIEPAKASIPESAKLQAASRRRARQRQNTGPAVKLSI